VAPRTALSDWLREMLRMTDGPTSRGSFGIGLDDLDVMVEHVMTHSRTLVCSPMTVNPELVRQILAAACID
jgi:alcohol dehydrogenase class IV